MISILYNKYQHHQLIDPKDLFVGLRYKHQLEEDSTYTMDIYKISYLGEKVIGVLDKNGNTMWNPRYNSKYYYIGIESVSEKEAEISENYLRDMNKI
jgi:hypothetical protein